MLLVNKKKYGLAVIALVMGSAHAGQFGENRVGIELLQLDRDSDQDITYVWDNGGSVNAHGNDTPVGKTGAFDDTADIGFRLMAARKLSSRWSIQANYMTSGELSESQSFSDPSSQLEIFWSGGTDEFDAADTVNANYTSELDGIELNAVYAVSDSIDIFGGIGQLNLDEKFRIVSNDFAIAGIGRYNIDTSNELLGLQIGLALGRAVTDKIDLYLLGKIGWYDNSSEQNQTVEDPVVAANRNVRASEDTSASVYEVRLGGSYRFTDNFLMNIGYQYIKMTDVALAESQFDVVGDGTNLDNDDEITWQGFNLGLNYYF